MDAEPLLEFLDPLRTFVESTAIAMGEFCPRARSVAVALRARAVFSMKPCVGSLGSASAK